MGIDIDIYTLSSSYLKQELLSAKPATLLTTQTISWQSSDDLFIFFNLSLGPFRCSTYGSMFQMDILPFNLSKLSTTISTSNSLFSPYCTVNPLVLHRFFSLGRKDSIRFRIDNGHQLELGIQTRIYFHYCENTDGLNTFNSSPKEYYNGSISKMAALIS